MIRSFIRLAVLLDLQHSVTANALPLLLLRAVPVITTPRPALSEKSMPSDTYMHTGSKQHMKTYTLSHATP